MPQSDNNYYRRRNARDRWNRYQQDKSNREDSRRNTTYSRQERQQREHDNYHNRIDAQQRRAKTDRDENNFNRMNQTEQRTAERRRSNAFAREEAAFNRGRDPERDRLDAARRHNKYQMEQLQRNAQNTIGRNNPTPSRNPTSSGDGSREWEDHKYIDKVQTKTGKIRYIYDIETSSGRHNSSTKPIGPNEMKRAKEELDKAKTGLNKPTKESLLAISQKKSGERNTGGSDKYHNPIKDTAEKARRFAYQATEAVSNATKSAAKAVSDGASFVTKNLSNAISNTPLKDLFK